MRVPVYFLIICLSLLGRALGFAQCGRVCLKAYDVARGRRPSPGFAGVFMSKKTDASHVISSLVDRIRKDSRGNPRLAGIAQKGVELGLWLLAGCSIRDTHVRISAESNRAICTGRVSMDVDWRDACGLLHSKTASFSAKNMDLRKPIGLVAYLLFLPFSGRAWFLTTVALCTFWFAVQTRPSVVNWRVCVDDFNINRGLWCQLMQVTQLLLLFWKDGTFASINMFTKLFACMGLWTP
jgi:hypothetical protein